jgi:4-hydroxybenzoate polyprenyltransferase
MKTKNITDMLIAIYRLLRIPNLLMIALTQYLVLYCVIKPNLELANGAQLLSNLNFALLVISTVMISAAGYIINDYFDLRADRINKPDKMSIGRKISRRTAILLHWIFNIIGVLIGLYLAYKIHVWKLGAINIMVSVLLWYYSTDFKKKLITGNLIIATLSAFVVVVVWLFEFFSVNNNAEDITSMFIIFRSIIIPYGLFAFLISFIRELIKDTEDMEGDRKIFCNTFPIIYGIQRTKYLLITLVSITVLMLSYTLFNIYFRYLYFIFWYLLITVEFPLIYIVFKIYKSETKEHFAALSLLTKVILFAGILSMQVFYL